MRHPDAWHDFNLARCEAVMAFCDNPNPETRAAMEQACSPRQPSLFTAPPHAGLITGGQPELPGWRMAASGATETIE